VETVIREARTGDRAAVAAFTESTFPWGDYVMRVYDDWLTDPAGRTLVAERAGAVVGMARAALLSPTEGWLQGIRVHPQQRRTGIASTLLEAAAAWAAEQGALVVRLTAETWNLPARALFRKHGFGRSSSWFMGERGVGENSPTPEGNGGRRVPPPERLRRSHAAEAPAAMMSWAPGPLGRAARNLAPFGWSWRRLALDDLTAAAASGTFWEGRPGWALGGVDRDTFRISWLETSPDDAHALGRALVDRADDAGVDRLEVMLPAVDWLRRSLERVGCSLHPLAVYGRGVA
jgi:GNAT superfamily N-acetyltransferase